MLVEMMMKWKRVDSIKDLQQQKKDQTKVWRESEAIIKNVNLDRRYQEIWTAEERRIQEKRSWYKRKFGRKL